MPLRRHVLGCCPVHRWPGHPVFWAYFILVTIIALRVSCEITHCRRVYREVPREEFRRLTSFDATTDSDVWSLWLLPGDDGFLVAHGPLTWIPENQRGGLDVWTRWFMTHVRHRVAASPVPFRMAFDDGFNSGWDWRENPTRAPTLVFGARVGDALALPVPDPQYIDFRPSYADALVNENDPRHAELLRPLAERVDRAVWRGALGASRERNFFDQCPAVADPSPAITADDVLPRALFVQVRGVTVVFAV
jgi:hypothetical protein